MNRNMILAFLIILVSIQFFTSETFYKIIKKPYPFAKKNEAVKEEKKGDIQDTAADIEEEQAEEEHTKAESEKGSFLEEPEKGIKTAEVIDTASLKEDTNKTDTIAVVKIDTVWVETDKLICGIDERGGRIISIKTKEYIYNNKREALKGKYIELISNKKKGGANLKINERNFDKEIFKFTGY